MYYTNRRNNVHSTLCADQGDCILDMGSILKILQQIRTVEGRYQGVTTGAGVFLYVLDTKTGEVIKFCHHDKCDPVDDTLQN